ncbi:MAG: FkbM family methyltransferase [Opitutaceae bacterium]|nr:FkbM family methyltransferase [Opitutaceae bacterium]
MKQFVKEIAQRLGYIVITHGHSAARYVLDPPAGVLDEVLLRVFPTLERRAFIQIGANDGVRADPIRRHIIGHAWTGLLVEPVPANFRALQRNYESRPGLTFLNAAVDREGGARTIHYLAPETRHVPDWFHGLASFDAEHLRRATREVPLPAEAFVSANVRTVTWPELLALFGPRRCDVLVIDTEGMDIALLRLANLSAWPPAVIVFEHGCVSRSDRLSFYGELLELGYELATAGADTVAYRARPRSPHSIYAA